MINWLLTLGVLAALTGATARNVTACALLGSYILSTGMVIAGVPFNLILWLVIDLAVILFIVRHDMRHRDAVILALFAPVWVLYIAQPAWWVDGVKLIVAVQMLLTFPVRRTWAASQDFIARLRDPDRLEMAIA